ncbi:LTA synthase family protein [Alkaliphilus serpentinus]|uniref:LTA synthase family protein n=1 Tax=Alkaliphilus serpentinus TaxID=1482731 RepID=A0A833HRG8_9FIRM|nr:LTA synthase family protein [Alkaliphilus serpentinus]KAB3531856.1 LTA synthase family protein [Alkaliphilus serpentinus]
MKKLKPYYWLSAFIILSTIKQVFVEGMMGISLIEPYTLMINLLIFSGLYAIVFVTFKKNKLIHILSVYSLLAIILFSNLIHYRYFHMPLSFYSFQAFKQVGAVKTSVFYLIKLTDALIFLDLIILWPLLFKKRAITEFFTSKKDRIMAYSLSIVVFAAAPVANNKILNGNTHTINQLGTINYHLQDLYGYIFDQSTFGGYDATVFNSGINLGEGKYHGLIEGRNIITIQVESMHNFVLQREIEGQPITPIMNSLINKDSIYFSRYYQQLGRGNTSDAEFVSNNSLYASMKTYSYKEYEGNELYTLPQVLKEEGYNTIAFHGNEPDFWNRKSIYPSIGFNTYISTDEMEMDEVIGMGISDGSLFKQSLGYLEKLPQPFYSFYVSLTSHNPFIIPEEQRGLTIDGEYKDTIIADYFQSVNYFDRMLGEFIEELKRRDLYDNSVIVIYGDHFALDIRKDNIKELITDYLGKPYDFEEFLNVGLLIHIPGSGITETYTTAGGQIDFFPTMMNLVGVDEIKGNILGKDLINTEEGFVAHQTYMIRGSFIDNEKVFEFSRDGRYENSRAWRIDNHEPVPLEECREGYERALREIRASEYLLDNNLSRQKQNSDE